MTSNTLPAINPIRVDVQLEDKVQCYGVLFQHVIHPNTPDSDDDKIEIKYPLSQIWIRFDDGTIGDMWIRDTRITAFQVVYPRKTNVFL